MYPTSRGVLSFQFAHLLPALLGQAQLIGGDRLMFAAPPVIGGAALLAFFVAAWRLLRNGIVALGALVCFAFLLPEVSFSRDSYSEIPMQVLVFTALWILTDRGTFLRPRIALVAGLFLGLLQAARIDGLVSLTGVGLLFAVMWLVTAFDRPPARRTERGRVRARDHPRARARLHRRDGAEHAVHVVDLHKNVRSLELGMVASVVFALLLVVIVPPIARRVHRVPDAVGWIAAAFVAVVGFGLWFVRPRVQHMHTIASGLMSGLQQAAGVAVDPRRNYAERSLVWMTWYLGPILVAAAIIGAALLVRELLRGRMVFTLAALALLGPASAVYLWRPNISTDQIWVMRRFLFSALPLLTLLAFGLVAALLRMRAQVDPALRAGRRRGGHRRGRRRVPDLDGRIGAEPDRTARRPPRGDGRVPTRWGTTRRSCCCRATHRPDVPVGAADVARLVQRAGRGDADRRCRTAPPSSNRLAAQWKADGRKFWVVADDAATIHAVLPGRAGARDARRS